jgi:hypothetical protein
MTMMRDRGAGIRVGIALVVVALAAAACGDDAADPTTTTAAAAGEVEVTAVDYGYVGLPERIAAGTTLTLVNDSSEELHEIVAIRLPDDETRSVAELVQDPEALAGLFPLVVAVVIAPPNASGFAVVGTGELAEPGRYAIICAIPVGADPDEYLAAAAESEGGPPDVPGGPPHFVVGMFAEMVVEG